MTHTDIAKRVYDHNWSFDPVIREGSFLSGQDFYKLLMGQMIFNYHWDTQVTFKLINRTTDVKLTEIIDPMDLIEQLDHVRSLQLSRGESTWLRGNTFYGKRSMFSPEYMDFLENLKLPDYEIQNDNGQFNLTFTGPWAEVTFWELPALAIISELKSRVAMQSMNRFELDVLYSRAKARLWDKIEVLKKIPDLKIADFGTRRRHSFLWQQWAIQAMMEGLGDRFIGTSNCTFALQNDLEAIGTNAHELSMTYAALADNDMELLQSPYKVLQDWETLYDGALQVILPDTFGTRSFFENAPQWVANWKGVRIDSGDNVANGDYVLDWFEGMGQDSREKLLLFSDGLDVESIVDLSDHFRGRCNVGFGWGTNLTNDFRDLGPVELNPISLVCKVTQVNGRPAVKLSDNPNKNVGSIEEVARYRKVFGTEGAVRQQITV